MIEEEQPRVYKEVWFNRATGMNDFLIERKTAPSEGENPIYSATVFEYAHAGDVYYVTHVLGKSLDYQIEREGRITGLTVNGATVGTGN